MISVEEAKKLVNAHATILSPITIALAKACSHTLATDVYAACNIPMYAQSSMDGYAIKFEDRHLKLRVVNEMEAGATRRLAIKNGECTRIFTGAPLPTGADTVVMQEKAVVERHHMMINDFTLTLGANVRDAGSEVRSGELALPKGNIILPATIGFLAAIGTTQVEVYPLPKVALIITGKELVKPGNPLKFGQVYESNSYALDAALKAEGIAQIEVAHAPDDLGILTTKLQEALNANDVVLLTGGVSVGDYDLVIEATKRCQVKQVFHKVKQRPGKPLFFGTKGKQLVFGLPGNPSSVLSCYYNYVLPALKKLSNKKNSTVLAKARLSHHHQKPAGLAHFLKGFYKNGDVTILGAQESFRLRTFAIANCLVCLPENEQIFALGDVVDVLLLPPI